MKKAIALLITLSLITIISVIVSKIITIMDNSLKEINKREALIQFDTLFNDIKKILDRSVTDINDSTSLELLFLLPYSFNDIESGININIEMESDSSKINPNLLMDVNRSKINDENHGEQINKDIYSLFDRILLNYNIQNRELFLSMLLDTIDEDKEERYPNSEIANFNHFFQNGEIINMRHFKQIIKRYRDLTLDKNIDNIPWDMLIGFRSKIIDFNYITPELLSFLLPSLDKESLYKITLNKLVTYDNFDELELPNDLNEQLKRYNIKFFSPEIWCIIDFQFNEYSKNISFQYNLKEKKVSYIEEF